MFAGRTRDDVDAAFQHVAFVHEQQVRLPAAEHLDEQRPEIFTDLSESIGKHLLRLRVDAVDHLQQLLLGLNEVVILAAEELVALFGLLVFVNGDEIDRPHFIDALPQGGHLLRHGIPVGRGAAGGHFLRSQSPDPGRTLVRDGDSDALAANGVQVHLIFLLNPLAQVLHGHVVLRQFHLERAALILQFAQTTALFPQVFLATGHAALQRISLSHQFSRLCAHLLAFELQTPNLLAGFFNLQLGL